MSFIADLLKLLSSLFGKKEEQPVEQEQVRVNTNNYVIPVAVRNGLDLARTTANLTDEEVADLEHQIKTMGSLGFAHYVMHTRGRGETSPYDANSGDRYWEMNYLKGAKTMDFITQYGGFPRSTMIKRGLEPIFYENLLS